MEKQWCGVKAERFHSGWYLCDDDGQFYTFAPLRFTERHLDRLRFRNFVPKIALFPVNFKFDLGGRGRALEPMLNVVSELDFQWSLQVAYNVSPYFYAKFSFLSMEEAMVFKMKV